MFRFLFRILATVALAVAVIMAVIDATRTVAAGELVVTPLGASWLAVSADTLQGLQAVVETSIHPLLWDPVLIEVLKAPGFAVLGVLALLFYAIGRRPERRIGRFAAES